MLTHKAEAQLTLARALRSSLDIPGATWTLLIGWGVPFGRDHQCSGRLGIPKKNHLKYQPKPPVKVALFLLELYVLEQLYMRLYVCNEKVTTTPPSKKAATTMVTTFSICFQKSATSQSVTTLGHLFFLLYISF